MLTNQFPLMQKLIEYLDVLCIILSFSNYPKKNVNQLQKIPGS